MGKGAKGVEELTPYGRGEKGDQIEAMFDHIAPAYDFMNSAMSLGQHKRWRNRALDAVREGSKEVSRILDVATGTGDVAFELKRRYPKAAVVGIDLSGGMLEVGRRRQADLPDEKKVEFLQADCLNLPFESESFDMVTVAYGVRNFSDLRKGISEMRRVLKPGGMLCVLELSRPENRLARLGYDIYCRVLPIAGKLIAGDSEAYSYLPRSIAACRQRRQMTELMEECGFEQTEWHSMTLGAVCYYLGRVSQ